MNASRNNLADNCQIYKQLNEYQKLKFLRYILRNLFDELEILYEEMYDISEFANYEKDVYFDFALPYNKIAIDITGFRELDRKIKFKWLEQHPKWDIIELSDADVLELTPESLLALIENAHKYC